MTNPWDEFDLVIDMDDKDLMTVLREMQSGNKKFLDDTYWLTRLASTAAKAKQSVWRLEQKIARKDEALRVIERWTDFPPAKLHDGTPCEYGTAWGASGERDYMRYIARQALFPLPHQQKGQTG